MHTLSHTLAGVAPAPRAQRARPRVVAVRATAAREESAAPPPTSSLLSRRSALLSAAATVTSATVTTALALPPSSRAGNVQIVSEYLPAYTGAGGPEFGLVNFIPGPTKTPALRAGTVKPDAPYSFALPPTWREARVANIQSGNYCQPKCEEPWTEVVFESPAQGSARVIVSPLRKLTPRVGPGRALPIDKVGTPASIIAALGSFVTGTYLDEEDVVTSTTAVDGGGNPQFQYEIYAPTVGGSLGPHAAVSVTAKGDLAFLFLVSANDKQWAKNADMLKAVAKTFTA